MIIYSHILLSLFSLVTCSRHGKPCVPTAGHTALIIGQDYYSIRNYTYALGADPFGVMAYTALESSTGSLTGLKMPIDYGSGIEWIEGLVDLYAGISLQVGLYLVNVCPKVLSGELDGNIESLSRYLRSINNPVYLRVGYEFDSFQNNYPTDCYIKMFQRIVNLFRTHKTYNVAFVWHSYGEAPRDNISVDSWYPGDEYVDWCGLSIFNQPYNCQTQHLCEFEYADRFLSFCKSRFKPSMIAESTPYGGIYDYGTSSKNRSIPSVIPNRAYITERASTLPSADGKSSSQPTKLDTWSAWFEHVIVYIKKHDIKIWSYINCDWDSMPMWRKEHAPGTHWGDTRVEAYPHTLTKWRSDVLGNARFAWTNSSTAIEQICKRGGRRAIAKADLLHLMQWTYAIGAIVSGGILLGYVIYSRFKGKKGNYSPIE